MCKENKKGITLYVKIGKCGVTDLQISLSEESSMLSNNDHISDVNLEFTADATVEVQNEVFTYCKEHGLGYIVTVYKHSEAFFFNKGDNTADISRHSRLLQYFKENNITFTDERIVRGRRVEWMDSYEDGPCFG